MFGYFVLLIHRDCKRDFYLQGNILWSIFSYSRLEKALKRKKKGKDIMLVLAHIYTYIYFIVELGFTEEAFYFLEKIGKIIWYKNR